MVIGGAGETKDSNGSSRGISNELDRKLIGHLRGLSDVVVTGGATARAENYRKPNAADLAVISRQTASVEGSITLTPPTHVELGSWVLDHLLKLGYSRVLLETGPSLSKTFLSADLVDEFCLTVTNGSKETARRFMDYTGSKLELFDSIESGSTLFTIWRRGNK
jgi:riboflavin biosynthesis pyrimidine reductase